MSLRPGLLDLRRRTRLAGVRPPAVAGAFYPDDAGLLRRTVQDLLAGHTGEAPSAPPKAVIAPHAGYRYSGPVAASAFAPLAPLAGRITRVVVIGPSHRVAFHGLALPAAECFATPLGRIEIDIPAAESLLELPQVRVDPAPHALEHGLEVELPFLQLLFGAFQIVPLVVGSASPEAVAEVLEKLWGGPETLLVVSSDLSHFLPYAAACRVDQETAGEILARRLPLTPSQACGAMAINGLLLALARHPLEPGLLDLRNSGDTAGGRDQVVGYGAFAFTEAAA